jgi:hypothetical protein
VDSSEHLRYIDKKIAALSAEVIDYKGNMDEFALFRNNIFDDIKVYISKENLTLRQNLADDYRKDMDLAKLKELDVNEIKLDLRNFITQS